MQSLGLDGLPVGASGIVEQVALPDEAQRLALALRLIEIGFMPGERVEVLACGPAGREPIAVRVGRSTFALRRHEAALVQVQPEVRA